MQDPALARMLTDALAAVLDGEPRAEAAATADALRASGPSGLAALQPVPDWAPMILAALAASPHPAAGPLQRAFGLIPWGANPVASRVAEVPDIYLVSTILGPDGPLICPGLRMGLFFQRPGTYYGLHNHLADETYAILAGDALWTAGDDIRHRTAGDVIHHPSLMPHAFHAGPAGLLALWRWSGDIDVASYAMLDDPLARQAEGIAAA